MLAQLLRCQQQVLSADRLTEVAGQGEQLVDNTTKLCAGAHVVRPGGVLTYRSAQGRPALRKRDKMTQ